MSKVVTRFAPSPTGHLHIGNARTALICYLFAKKLGGEFILRIDDTDLERSKEEYADSIKEDLTWLGLKWDKIERQSARLARYEEVKKKLMAEGRIYPCYESATELEVKRKMLLKRGKPPIYDRAALSLTPEQISKYEAEGRKPHFRFKLNEGQIKFHDLVKGDVVFEQKNLSDPVIIREDGSPTYLLPSAVDDVDMGITHVVRGEDHVTNTAIQVQIFEALSGRVPHFAHLALLKVKDGKISKREGGFEIKALKEEGIEALAINSFLARIGTSEVVEARTDFNEIVKNFDISKFSKAPTNYEVEELSRINTKVLHQFSFNEVKERLKTLGVDKVNENFWLSVRSNLKKFSEVKDWWHILSENMQPVIDDAEFTKAAGNLLPSGNWNETTWDAWMSEVKAKTGRKGKELFMPIRKALTGMEHGPELKILLPLIGREKALARLEGKAA